MPSNCLNYYREFRSSEAIFLQCLSTIYYSVKFKQKLTLKKQVTVITIKKLGTKRIYAQYVVRMHKSPLDCFVPGI